MAILILLLAAVGLAAGAAAPHKDFATVITGDGICATTCTGSSDYYGNTAGVCRPDTKCPGAGTAYPIGNANSAVTHEFEANRQAASTTTASFLSTIATITSSSSSKSKCSYSACYDYFVGSTRFYRVLLSYA